MKACQEKTNPETPCRIRTFLKNHLAIVLGLSLPLVLIFLLTGFQLVARTHVAPPAHAVLLVDTTTPSYWQFEQRIEKNGKLAVYFRATEKNDCPCSTVLTLFHPAQNLAETFEITMDAPSRTPGTPAPVALPPALADRTFSRDRMAPDGYRFSEYGPYNDYFFLGLFNDGRHDRTRPVISKPGKQITVPLAYGQLVGWSVEPEPAAEEPSQ